MTLQRLKKKIGHKYLNLDEWLTRQLLQVLIYSTNGEYTSEGSNNSKYSPKDYYSRNDSGDNCLCKIAHYTH